MRRQGAGLSCNHLWQSFSDPLAELLADHPEAQFDLLETRHASKVLLPIMQHCAALMKTCNVSVNAILLFSKRRITAI